MKHCLSILLATAFSIGLAPNAFAHDNEITVKVADGKRCFIGNGLPDHATGTFPNSGNPNAIEKQAVSSCVTTSPVKHSTPVRKQGSIGIGINGVEFRPGTAGWYDGTVARGNSRNPASGWKLEGLNPGNILGMDAQNAHVGPNGLYHYHGVANALVKSAGNGPIGYAADGFEIRYGGAEKPGFKLKSGARPSDGLNPGGAYDGTYEQDFSYVAGSGTLDECNGRMVGGTYVYFATESFPFLPRCLWGDVSTDFERNEHGGDEQRSARREQREGGGNERGPNRGEDRGQDRGRRGPPQVAINACSAKTTNAECSFSGRGNREVTGSCRFTPENVKACVPAGRQPRG